MNEVISRDRCCGCGECAVVCPVHAIEMHTDEAGFRVPVINSSICIDCGKCLKFCAVANAAKLKHQEGDAFGAINSNIRIRKESSSGGAFSALAETFLDDDGVVYGAVSVNNFICHKSAKIETELSAMRGSKYVQSNIENVFLEIENQIKRGQKVLFSGTPCQCAAIKSYLSGKHLEMEQLVLIDMVCHGVCSPLVFQNYIEFCDSRSKSRVVEHIFRSKVNGWCNHTEENIFSDGTIDSTSFDSQLFKSFFYSHYCLRESCFQCQFATTQRVSDITMADFWGIQKSHPQEYSPDGVSLLVANSDKGKLLVKASQKRMRLFPAELTDTEQPQLYHPSKKPDDINKFWKIYKKGFKYVAIKYFHAGKIRRFCTDMIKSIIRV